MTTSNAEPAALSARLREPLPDRAHLLRSADLLDRLVGMKARVIAAHDTWMMDDECTCEHCGTYRDLLALIAEAKRGA